VQQLALRVDLNGRHTVVEMNLEPIATVSQYHSTFGSMPVRSLQLYPVPFNDKLTALLDRDSRYFSANAVANLRVRMAVSRYPTHRKNKLFPRSLSFHRPLN
jgi:hypothetical protein